MDVFPDFDGLRGVGDLREVIGTLMTFVLIAAVLMLIICAIFWALATPNGHHAATTKARVGAWTALIVAPAPGLVAERRAVRRAGGDARFMSADMTSADDIFA